MSTLKHTPGPWAVHESMRDCVTFEGHYGTENLFLENVEGYYACQNEDDARLIAAAPDLLAALIEAIDCGLVPTSSAAEGGAMRFSRQVHVADQIRAAIAKATGEAP